VTLDECILHCARVPALVAEFDRLSGTHLSKPRSALDAMIDEATGRDDEALAKFCAFVTEYIWMPVYGAAALAALEGEGSDGNH
jgi:hypothetical protein